MVSLTLAVPEELKKKMDKFEQINWSAVARQAFIQQIRDMEFISKMQEKSTMTEEDAIKFGRELNKRATKRLSEQLSGSKKSR